MKVKFHGFGTFVGEERATITSSGLQFVALRGHPVPVIFISTMIKNSMALLLAMGLVFFGSRIAGTQSQADLEAMRKELGDLKANQEKLQRELETLKQALRGSRRAPDAFQPVVLNVGDDPYKGELNAKLTIVDFSDYQ